MKHLLITAMIVLIDLNEVASARLRHREADGKAQLEQVEICGGIIASEP